MWVLDSPSKIHQTGEISHVHSPINLGIHWQHSLQSGGPGLCRVHQHWVPNYETLEMGGICPQHGWPLYALPVALLELEKRLQGWPYKLYKFTVNETLCHCDTEPWELEATINDRTCWQALCYEVFTSFENKAPSKTEEKKPLDSSRELHPHLLQQWTSIAPTVC